LTALPIKVTTCETIDEYGGHGKDADGGNELCEFHKFIF
jgi:hypothetical protein